MSEPREGERLFTDEQIKQIEQEWIGISPHRLQTETKLNKLRKHTKYFYDLRNLLDKHIKELEKNG